METILMDLILENPYYSYLAAQVRFLKDQKQRNIRTEFEGMPIIKYNKDWFDKLTYSEQKGAIIHELLHLALLHFFRRDGRDPVLWHMACDIAVTEVMEAEWLHEAMLTSRNLFIDHGIILPSKAPAETYYNLLRDNEQQKDYHYKIEPLMDMNPKDIAVLSLIDQLATVQTVAQNENAIEENLSHQTEEIYKNYKIDWRHVLKKFLTGQGITTKRSSYKKVSRRFDDRPGTKRSMGLNALIAIDESGSIANETIDIFYRELIRVRNINHAQIRAVSFDTTCSEPKKLNQFLLHRHERKHGGTDFRPIFELADKLRTPLVIVFTDGEGQAPDRINQKVLWVLTENGKKPMDYGYSVKMIEGAS